MKNKRIVFAAIAVLTGVILYAFRAKKDKRTVGVERGKGSVCVEVAHDISEGLKEELEGFKNRVFS